jgi:hypothetical protein
METHFRPGFCNAPTLDAINVIFGPTHGLASRRAAHKRRLADRRGAMAFDNTIAFNDRVDKLDMNVAERLKDGTPDILLALPPRRNGETCNMGLTVLRPNLIDDVEVRSVFEFLHETAHRRKLASTQVSASLFQ